VADGGDRLDSTRREVEVEPRAGRRARLTRRARALQVRVEASRTHHRSVEICFGLVRRDAEIGGGLLAGALAYRLFILLLPTTLLLVSGLGLYAGSVDKSTATVAEEAGLHGLVASEVAATASGRHKALVFLLMVPPVLYAMVALYRAVAKVHAIAWYGSAHGVRTTRKGIAVFTAALVLQLVATETVGRIRRSDQFGGLAALLVYLILVGGAWLAVSIQLPHRPVRWFHLLPGALLVGIGLLFVNVFNVYVTTRLVENSANTYGALGVATALLLSLVLVGRVMVTSAELNASLSEDHRPGQNRDRGVSPPSGT
jgi:membrane protein